MALNFSASLSRNITRVLSEVNAKCNKISIELFLAIVRRTPSPDNPGEWAKGLLANQWYPKAGSGFSSNLTDATSDNGTGSRSRIIALRGGTEFLGKNGRLTLTNNVPYAYRAEVLGWPKGKDPNSEWTWSGKVGPYRMVALSLQEVAARYK